MIRMSNALVSGEPGSEEYAQTMAAFGRESMAGMVPQAEALQAVTAKVGVGGPTGIDLEGKARKLLGQPEQEQYDPYRVNRSIRDRSAVENDKAVREGSQFNDTPYLLAEQLVNSAAKGGDCGALMNSMTADEAVKQLSQTMAFPVDSRDAKRALEIVRESATQSYGQRATSVLANFFLGQRVQEYPEGERIAARVTQGERGAMYNPYTGTGSRAQMQEYQKKWPMLNVQRYQDGALPDDVKDYRYLTRMRYQEQIRKQFSDIRAEIIRKEPWNKAAVAKVENAMYEALATVQEATPEDTTTNMPWKASYDKLLADLGGSPVNGKEPSPLLDAYDPSYFPRSTYGANPQEAIGIHAMDIARLVGQTKP